MATEHERILIVEDDLKLADLIQAFLRSQGLEVDLLTDGAGAVEHILASNPDLVVLDLMLPGEDGLSICKRLRAGRY